MSVMIPSVFFLTAQLAVVPILHVVAADVSAEACNIGAHAAGKRKPSGGQAMLQAHAQTSVAHQRKDTGATYVVHGDNQACASTYNEVFTVVSGWPVRIWHGKDAACRERCTADTRCKFYAQNENDWCWIQSKCDYSKHTGGVVYQKTAEVAPTWVVFADPEKDGKKCFNSGSEHRVFDLRGGNANLEACKTWCDGMDNCLSFSGVFGSWCIGCDQFLENNADGAVAYVKPTCNTYQCPCGTIPRPANAQSTTLTDQECCKDFDPCAHCYKVYSSKKGGCEIGSMSHQNSNFCYETITKGCTTEYIQRPHGDDWYMTWPDCRSKTCSQVEDCSKFC